MHRYQFCVAARVTIILTGIFNLPSGEDSSPLVVRITGSDLADVCSSGVRAWALHPPEAGQRSSAPLQQGHFYHLKKRLRRHKAMEPLVS